MRLTPRETLRPAGFARPSAETPKRVGQGAIICAGFSPLAASRLSAADRLRCADADHRNDPPGRAATATRRARRLRRFPTAVTAACFPPPAGCVLRVAQAPREIRGAFALLHFETCRLAAARPALIAARARKGKRKAWGLARVLALRRWRERAAGQGSGRLPRSPTNYPAPGNFTLPASLRHFRRRRAASV